VCGRERERERERERGREGERDGEEKYTYVRKTERESKIQKER